MLNKVILSALVSCISLSLLAQTFGEIGGKVMDSSGAPFLGAVISVSDGASVKGDQSDLDGRFRIRPLVSGMYTVTIRATGKSTVVVKGVEVLPEQMTVMKDVYLADSVYSAVGGPIIIYAEIDPLIRKDGSNFTVIRAKDLKNLPSANGGDIKKIVISQMSDVKTNAQGTELYFRGSRSGSVVYFIDGVKIRENVPNIPSSGISSIAVYTGGVPAKYGDSTGGYIIIETKNYLEEFYARTGN